MKQKIFSLTLGVLAGLVLFFLVSKYTNIIETVSKSQTNPINSNLIMPIKWSWVINTWNNNLNTWYLNKQWSWTWYFSWNQQLWIKRWNRSWSIQ